MKTKKLSETEKRKILKEILGAKYSSVGDHFPIYSEFMSKLDTANNILAYAELIPVLNSFLSGAVTVAAIETASFVGTLLSPFVTMINLINANESGVKSYSYRCTAYTITSWVFNLPVPAGSRKVISNLSNGIAVASKSDIEKYTKTWRKVSPSVLHELNLTSKIRGINSEQLKIIFKTFAGNKPEIFCKNILIQYEDKFPAVSVASWKANYSILYPM